MSYRIREALESDAEGITSVHVSSWKTSYGGIIDQIVLDTISYEDRLSYRRKVLKDKDSLYLVAVIDDQIVGFADAGLVRPDVEFEKHPLLQNKMTELGEIYAIYVVQEHKRKGIGKAFFKHCRLWFKQQKLGYFVVWALEDNLKARSFYEKEGGEIIGQKIFQIGDKNYKESGYWFSTVESERNF